MKLLSLLSILLLLGMTDYMYGEMRNYAQHPKMTIVNRSNCDIQYHVVWGKKNNGKQVIFLKPGQLIDLALDKNSNIWQLWFMFHKPGELKQMDGTFGTDNTFFADKQMPRYIYIYGDYNTNAGSLVQVPTQDVEIQQDLSAGIKGLPKGSLSRVIAYWKTGDQDASISPDYPGGADKQVLYQTFNPDKNVVSF